MASKTIYLIRHGEKPTDDTEVQNEKDYTDLDNNTWSINATNDYNLSIDTLNRAGLERRDALASVFVKAPGPDPTGNKRVPYNIGLIIAQKVDATGSKRPQETVSLLAKKLGSSTAFNTSIETDNFTGVAQAVEDFDKEGDILICWEHCRLINIAEALKVQNPPPYPDDRFDLIWTVPRDMQGSNRQLKSITSEKTKAELDAENINNSWSRLTAPGAIGWEEKDSRGNAIRTLTYTEQVAAKTFPTDRSTAPSQWNEQILDGKHWKDKEYWWREEGTDGNVAALWGRTKHKDGDWVIESPGSTE